MTRLAAVAASLALAAAPSATTGPVTSVGATTATVSGSVNPNGTPTSWNVEYGTTRGSDRTFLPQPRPV